MVTSVPPFPPALVLLVVVLLLDFELPPQPEATSASVTTTPKKPTNHRFTRTISFRSTHRGSVLVRTPSEGRMLAAFVSAVFSCRYCA